MAGALRFINDGGSLIHVTVHVEHEPRVPQRHRGDIHADAGIARTARENRDAAGVAGGEHARLLQAELAAALVNVFAQQIVKFVGAHRALEFGSLDDFPYERVGVEQHVVVKENVVDANDAVTVQFHVVQER